MRREQSFVVLTRLALAAGCASVVACGPARPRSGDALPEGAILMDFAQGLVVRIEVDNVVVLTAGDIIEPSQVIETSDPDGAAGLRLADGRQVLLGAGTRLRLARPAPTRGSDAEWAFLEEGSLRAGPSFSRGHPVVVSTPRGRTALDGRAPIVALSRSRR